MKPSWRFWVRLGFKPYLIRCPRGEHVWRRTYGDERGFIGAIYLCEECPRKTDNPSGRSRIIDPTQDGIDKLQVRPSYRMDAEVWRDAHPEMVDDEDSVMRQVVSDAWNEGSASAEVVPPPPDDGYLLAMQRSERTWVHPRTFKASGYGDRISIDYTAPDLVVIEFGINDEVKKKPWPPWYPAPYPWQIVQRNLAKIIETVSRGADPIARRDMKVTRLPISYI